MGQRWVGIPLNVAPPQLQLLCIPHCGRPWLFSGDFIEQAFNLHRTWPISSGRDHLNQLVTGHHQPQRGIRATVWRGWEVA